MTRWLFALSGALLVTLTLAFVLGWVLGQGASPDAGPAPAEAGTGLAAGPPERPEIPVRHVYPVPVWGLGGEEAAPPPAVSRSDILVSAAPGLAPVLLVSCTVRLKSGEAGVGIEPVACSPAEFARVRALVEAGLEGEDMNEDAPRLVELTARFEVEAEEAG